LVLGVGTGTTLGAVAQDPEIAEVQAAELSSEILQTVALFSGVNDRVLWRPNVRLRWADARSLARSAAIADTKFDVVIGDLFHPQRSGSGGLYTTEHFTAIRSALAPSGIFVQWVPLHELPVEAFASLTATFLNVFPQSEAFVAHFNAHGTVLGLVGGSDGLIVDGDALNARLQQTSIRQALSGTLLEQLEELFGGFVGDRAALSRWAAGAPVATDDRPSIERLAAVSERVDPFATLEYVLDGSEGAAVPLMLRGAEGQPRLAAIGRYRSAVIASLHGQIAQDRGNLDAARRYYQAGIAADDRFSLNGIQLQKLR